MNASSFQNLLQNIFGANLVNPQQSAYRGVRSVFIRKYHAYSPAYWNSQNRDKLEKGDKIVLPASALEELSRMHVEFPIMFEIANDSDILPKKSHCSVMEFTAPEGSVYLPLWMIDNLGIDAAGESVIQLTTVSLPKGNFVQFQAHETKFAMLSNPRVVLETALRSYSCLTVGDTIQVEFADYIYKLDVTEVKPAVQRGTAPPAISIIETDIKVDFKEPRDYKEWEKEQKKRKLSSNIRKVKSLNKMETKVDDEQNSDDEFAVDPLKLVKDAKKQYFNDLETSGFKLKQKSKRKSLSDNNNNNNNNSNNYNVNNNGYMNKNILGTTLGKQRGTALGVKKNNYNASNNQLNKNKSNNFYKSSNKKKVEEIVGNMRYIYEIDDNGKRTLLRRLPVRKVSVGSHGYSMK